MSLSYTSIYSFTLLFINEATAGKEQFRNQKNKDMLQNYLYELSQTIKQVAGSESSELAAVKQSLYDASEAEFEYLTVDEWNELVSSAIISILGNEDMTLQAFFAETIKEAKRN